MPPGEVQPHFEALPEDLLPYVSPPAPIKERSRDEKTGQAPLGFEPEEGGEFEPMQGQPPPEAPAAPVRPGDDVEFGVLPEAARTPPPVPTTAPLSPPAEVAQDWPAQAGPAVTPQESPQGMQTGGNQGGEVVGKLEEILGVLNEIKEATSKNAESIASLKDALDGVGTYAA
jgi:hypothetical protein